MPNCRHEWAKCMEGHIMSQEAWCLRMGRRARCMRCGEYRRGYEAAQVIRLQYQIALNQRLIEANAPWRHP